MVVVHDRSPPPPVAIVMPAPAPAVEPALTMAAARLCTAVVAWHAALDALSLEVISEVVKSDLPWFVIARSWY